MPRFIVGMFIAGLVKEGCLGVGRSVLLLSHFKFLLVEALEALHCPFLLNLAELRRLTRNQMRLISELCLHHQNLQLVTRFDH